MLHKRHIEKIVKSTKYYNFMKKIIALENVCKECPNYTLHCGLINTPSLCMELDQYLKGYHQAEKDLVLSWEDMMHIWAITEEVPDMAEEDFYKEVLRRFNEERNKV